MICGVLIIYCLLILTSVVNSDKLFCENTSSLIPPERSDGSESSLSASSVYENRPDTRPEQSRIGNVNAWVANIKNKNQWIQVDFGEVNLVTSVQTQGRSTGKVQQWVESYHISYGVNSTDRKFIMGDNREEKLFTGNADRSTVVENIFENGLIARYVRLHPQTWNGFISLRWDVKGCALDEAEESTTVGASGSVTQTSVKCDSTPLCQFSIVHIIVAAFGGLVIGAVISSLATILIYRTQRKFLDPASKAAQFGADVLSDSGSSLTVQPAVTSTEDPQPVVYAVVNKNGKAWDSTEHELGLGNTEDSEYEKEQMVLNNKDKIEEITYMVSTEENPISSPKREVENVPHSSSQNVPNEITSESQYYNVGNFETYAPNIYVNKQLNTGIIDGYSSEPISQKDTTDDENFIMVRNDIYEES